jgi:hypothetical protein
MLSEKLTPGWEILRFACENLPGIAIFDTLHCVRAGSMPPMTRQREIGDDAFQRMEELHWIELTDESDAA